MVFIAVLFMWDFLLYIDVVFDILDKQMRSRIVLKNFVVGKSCNICVLTMCQLGSRYRWFDFL